MISSDSSGGLSPSDLLYQEKHIHESKVSRVIASNAISFLIVLAAISFRFLARRINGTPLKLDDWCILGSVIFTITCFGLQLSLIPTGLGRHAIVATNLALFQVLGLASEIAYCTALLMIKTSTLLLLQRIFRGKVFTRLLWVLGFIVVLHNVVQIIFMIMECLPLETNMQAVLNGACSKITLNIQPILVTSASLNIATDWAMFCMPIPKLWKLKVCMKEKIQLISIFLLGALVCVISIVRFPKLLDFSLLDATWMDADYAIWSVLELGFATLSACVPTMRPLLDGISRRRLGSRQKTSSTSKSRTVDDRKPWTVKYLDFVRIPDRLLGNGYGKTGNRRAEKRDVTTISVAEMGVNSVVEIGVNSVTETGEDSLAEDGHRPAELVAGRQSPRTSWLNLA